MVKHFFIFMTTCFILMFQLAAHADVINDPLQIILSEILSNDLLLTIIGIVIILITVGVLIRVFWKPKKDNKSDS
jgi:hypothetical protein